VGRYWGRLGGPLAVDHLGLQRWRRCARLAVVAEGGQAPIRSSEIRKDFITGRRVQEKDRRPLRALTHGLRPQAELGLGVIPGECGGARGVGGPLNLLGLVPQLGGSQ